MVDQEHVETRAFDAVDGERGAVEGDGAFRGDEFGELARRFEREAHRFAFVLACHDRGHAVDMARHDVAAELVADLQRALEVDAGAGEGDRRTRGSPSSPAPGRAFCAGADLRGDGSGAGDFAGTFWEKPTPNSFESGWEIFKPVIAAVNGHCLGYGLTLVTWCDFVIASERADVRLPRGAHRRADDRRRHPAARSASAGRRPWSCCSPASASTPSRAKEIGLAGWVVPHDDAAATRPAPSPTGCCRARRWPQRAIKEVAMRAAAPVAVEAIRFGETMRKVAGATEDAAEGGRAVREGRPPSWKGR